MNRVRASTPEENKLVKYQAERIKYLNNLIVEVDCCFRIVDVSKVLEGHYDLEHERKCRIQSQAQAIRFNK